MAAKKTDKDKKKKKDQDWFEAYVQMLIQASVKKALQDSLKEIFAEFK